MRRKAEGDRSVSAIAIFARRGASVKSAIIKKIEMNILAWYVARIMVPTVTSTEASDMACELNYNITAHHLICVN